jgi:hypothetical protein
VISVMRIWRDLDLNLCFEESGERECVVRGKIRWEAERGWRRWIGNIKGSKSKFDRLYLILQK